MAHPLIRIGLALTLAAAVWAPARADGGAALVVAVQGAVSPEPAAFSEAAEGTVYTLADDAEMIVMHYAACVESHVRGGEVTVGPLGVRTTGETVSETDVECPRKVAFAEGANAVAAVVLRGGEERTVINARPLFVLLQDGVDRVEIWREGAVVARIEVDGRLARWPDGENALAPGDGYEIAVVVDGAVRTAAAAVARDAGVTVIQP